MHEDLSRQLRKERLAAGLTLSQLARRVHTSAATLSRYENGWGRFEVYTLRKLATALGCRLRIRLEPRKRPGEDAPPSHAEGFQNLKRLFWDHDLREADLEAHPVWILERVLEYGSLADVQFLIRRMGRRTFLEGVREARMPTARTRSFWLEMLEMEGLSCTRKYCRDTVWTS
jgi:transcriptional regulator with XRE-family HTH domain